MFFLQLGTYIINIGNINYIHLLTGGASVVCFSGPRGDNLGPDYVNLDAGLTQALLKYLREKGNGSQAST